MRLPESRRKFITLVNLVWWSLPLGVTLELSYNLSAHVTNSDADSSSLVLIPMYVVWLVLWICFNIFLSVKKNSYPSGAPLFGWDQQRNLRSWIWTLLFGVFIAACAFVVVDELSKDISDRTFSVGIYIPLVFYIFCSLQMRAVFVHAKN
ncbi:MAG: hypothetical protein ACAH59_14280 [Pseudobdellovibrionaceae bacterium]